MLYRRTPRNPPTLLLRIVATAGAGTLLGMASCGGDIAKLGLLPLSEPSDANVDDAAPVNIGVIDMSDSSLPCGGGPCGSVALPESDGGPLGHGLVHHIEDASAPNIEDASAADVEVHGVAPLPEDAGADAHDVILGVVAKAPDAGHDGGSTLTCPPLCGIIIGVAPHPGH